jgi:hypothetical protein
MQDDIEGRDSATAAATLVKHFYTLLASADGSAVATFIADNFASDAVLKRPESLPGGGVRSGAERIGRFMSAAVGGVSGLELRSLHVAPNGDSVAVFAELHLTLGETSTTALEWWTYTSGRFTALTAYYWDTATLLKAASAG